MELLFLVRIFFSLSLVVDTVVVVVAGSCGAQDTPVSQNVVNNEWFALIERA